MLLASPTGRAAQRMTEATGAATQTIHRLLKFDPVGGYFVHCEKNPLKCGCLIIDEAGMLDNALASALFQAIPREAHLILVGDVNQLPSVGPEISSMTLFALARLLFVNWIKFFARIIKVKS